MINDLIAIRGKMRLQIEVRQTKIHFGLILLGLHVLEKRGNNRKKRKKRKKRKRRKKKREKSKKVCFIVRIMCNLDF